MATLQAFNFLNWPVILAVVAVFLLLRWRRAGTFTWASAVWLGIFAIFRLGFVTPIPWSVVNLYMGIVTLSLAAYVTSDSERRAAFGGPIVSLVVDPAKKWLLAVVLVLLPALAVAGAYMGTREKLEAPGFGRTVHPAPPDTITVHDKTIDTARGHNPLRELERTDPEKFKAHLNSGRQTYYQNCFFCHGDALAGDGMYAHGLNPIPTNFADKSTIAGLQESFLFWRISKGGPGLPAEGGPWDSAMPAWERFLTEEQMWEVILYLYDFTETRPRQPGEEH